MHNKEMQQILTSETSKCLKIVAIFFKFFFPDSCPLLALSNKFD